VFPAFFSLHDPLRGSVARCSVLQLCSPPFLRSSCELGFLCILRSIHDGHRPGLPRRSRPP